MKICLLTTRHGPRDDRIFYKEGISLAKRYGKVTMVTPGGSTHVPIQDERFDFRLLSSQPGWRGRLATLREAVQVVREIAPDICHFHDPDQLATLPWLRRAAKSVIYDVHELYPESFAQSAGVPSAFRPLVKKAFRWFENRCARSCSAVVTAVDPLTERFSRAGAQATTIFNYPRTVMFEQPCEVQARSRHFPGRRVVLYQGNITRARGLHQMILAVDLVRKEAPDVLLVLVGPILAAERKEAEELACTLGLGDHVVFVGGVNHFEVFEYIREAEIGLVPFLAVGQYPVAVPIKLFEYFSCGVPAVGSNLAATKYYIEECGGGLTYEASRHDEMAASIVRLLQNDGEREQMGRRGRQAVVERWNWEEMEKRLFAVYDSVRPRLSEAVPR